MAPSAPLQQCRGRASDGAGNWGLQRRRLPGLGGGQYGTRRLQQHGRDCDSIGQLGWSVRPLEHVEYGHELSGSIGGRGFQRRWQTGYGGGPGIRNREHHAGQWGWDLQRRRHTSGSIWLSHSCGRLQRGWQCGPGGDHLCRRHGHDSAGRGRRDSHGGIHTGDGQGTPVGSGGSSTETASWWP
jgi:hypothetical protein